MSYIKDEILQVSQEMSLNIKEMSENDTLACRKILAENFSTEPEMPLNLSYQNLVSGSSYHDPNGWRLVERFVDAPVILFVNPDVDLCMFELARGEDLTKLLGGCIGFPFYVSSAPFDFLICFDDNNCLVCTGRAKDWCDHLKCSR